MSGVIDSFFAKLGFQVDTQGVEQFEAKAASLRSTVLAVGALATVAAGALGAMVLKVAQGMDDVGDFADIVDMTAREVAALGKVADMNDSSMGAMKTTIQGLSNVIGQASLGVGRGAKIFETLGFEAKDATGATKGAYDMLGEVADRMKGMTAGEKLALASKMGIDSSLIPLLSKGGEAFRKLKEEAEAANPLTEEQYKQADTIVKLWNKATASAGIFTKILAAKLFPVMERVLTYWNDLFKAGKKATNSWVSAGLDVFVATLVTLWDWMGRIVDAVKTVVTWVTQFKIVAWAAGLALAVLIAYQAGSFFLALCSAIAAAATALFTFNAAAILPVALIGGIVIAIALLVDELVNFYEGNDSVIGQLSKDYPYAVYIAEAALGLITAALVALKWQAITTVASMLVSVATLAAGWVASFASMAVATIAATWPLLLLIGIIAAIGVAIYAFYTKWDVIVGLFMKDWNEFTDLLKSATKSALDFVVGLFDDAKAKVMGYIDAVTGAISKVGELLGMSGASVNINSALAGAASPSVADMVGGMGSPGGMIGRPEGASNSATSTTNDTTTITGTVINVTSTDPAKAGESVREAFQSQIKRSVRNGQSAKQL
jgi:hypothetical protein